MQTRWSGRLVALICAVTATPAFWPVVGWAQSESRRGELIAAARRIIEDARYCALITLDESGAPRARSMDAFSPEEDLTVWLATNPRSRKTRDIERDPRVALYYFPPGGYGYVSITGKAVLVDDPAEKRRRWKEGWEEFYPDRPEGYILIKVVAERLEVVDNRLGLQGDPETWAAPAVEPGSPR